MHLPRSSKACGSQDLILKHTIPQRQGDQMDPGCRWEKWGQGLAAAKLESVGSGMDGNWNWDSQRAEWGLVRMDTKRGRKTGF